MPDVCMYVCMHACMYVRMYVGMYVCIYACMYVCTRMHTCMHTHDVYVYVYVMNIYMYTPCTYTSTQNVQRSPTMMAPIFDTEQGRVDTNARRHRCAEHIFVSRRALMRTHSRSHDTPRPPARRPPLPYPASRTHSPRTPARTHVNTPLNRHIHSAREYVKS